MPEESIYYVMHPDDELQLWAIHAAETTEELRLRAVRFLTLLRDGQTEAGKKPTAVVWLGKDKISPTKAEVAAYRARVKEVLALSQQRAEHAAAEALEALLSDAPIALDELDD